MLLTSSSYFAFAATVFLAYWLMSRHRSAGLAVILIANYFFYARWGLVYLALIPLWTPRRPLWRSVGAGLALGGLVAGGDITNAWARASFPNSRWISSLILVLIGLGWWIVVAVLERRRS